MMRKKLLVMLLTLLMAVTPALATTAEYVTVSGNGASVLVPVKVDPEEHVLFATGTLDNDKLKPVIAPNSSLVVDGTTANPRASILNLPLGTLADMKLYDTNADLHAWTLLSRSGVQFNKDFMKAIYGSAVKAVIKDKLRSMADDFSYLWDKSDDPNELDAFSQAADASQLALEIGLDSSYSDELVQQGKAINGKPIIGGVYMWVAVAGSDVNSRTPVQVRTQFDLPAGGNPTGVTVVHEDNGKTTAIPCTVSGSDISFETTARGHFFVLYDENAIIPVPATGDTSRLGLWAVLMAACGCAALVLLRTKKRA